MSRWHVVAVIVLVAGACAGDEVPALDPDGDGALVPPPVAAPARNQVGFTFPDPPPVPEGPLEASLAADLDTFFSQVAVNLDIAALRRIGESGDARTAWLLSDLLRFFAPGPVRDLAIDGFTQLTGADLAADPVAARSTWQSLTDHLIAWDLPEPPGYVRWKGMLFTTVAPRWAPFFEDENADIDWRHLSWGGVLIDDRPLGDTQPCERGCIPALDDPAVTPAADGGWYPDDAIVFGITVAGESRAYPKNIMEVHEMVNDTLGNRRLGIPYCTLCGSAQAYFTDSVPGAPEPPVLRTSGLLTRSNKVMFDLGTFSVFDTFTGRALSGPLHDAGVVLAQTTVVTSTWGEWKLAHPETTIVAEDGGIGRTYSSDPLRGRDDDGPIFPIGDVDERLPVQEQVLGVIAADGTPVAFPVAAAVAELEAGGAVQILGVGVVADGSGIRAESADGTEVVAHQAFWFAWSQFHPDTVVWARNPDGG